MENNPCCKHRSIKCSFDTETVPDCVADPLLSQGCQKKNGLNRIRLIQIYLFPIKHHRSTTGDVCVARTPVCYHQFSNLDGELVSLLIISQIIHKV